MFITLTINTTRQKKNKIMKPFKKTRLLRCQKSLILVYLLVHCGQRFLAALYSGLFQRFHRLHKRNFNPAKGWRKALHMQKRSLWKRIKDWKKGLRPVGRYKLGGQVAMF